jgi:hypothetical protein
MRIALLAILIAAALSAHGIDVSQPFSTSTYDCFKKNGMSFVIIRGFCSYGGVDTHAVAGLQSAKAAGV